MLSFFGKHRFILVRVVTVCTYGIAQELRMQLAADRVTRAPSDYSSFSKHLSDKGDPRTFSAKCHMVSA